MNGKVRKLLIPLAVIVLCVALGATMMVIGRGHTIYFDNKKLEYNGQTYEPFHKVQVFVKGESACKLTPRDRGSAIWLGQNFHMDLLITDENGQEQFLGVDVPLPYSIDGIIINLPALMNGAGRDAWMDEFIPAPEPVTEDDPNLDIGDVLGGGTEVFE